MRLTTPDVLTQITRTDLNPSNGNMFLSWIYVVPDGPQGVMMEKACDNGKTYLQLREGDTDSPSLIVCPRGLSTAPSLGRPGQESRIPPATVLGLAFHGEC